jgi:uncharacterized protein (TIGR00369 family)
MPTPQEFKAQVESSGIHHHLGITIREATKERVVLEMPVTSTVHQPFGLLHGGVSALLAESAASFGASLNAEGKGVVGIEIAVSHLRSMTEGTLVATATPIRIGRAVQVWHIDLSDQDGRQIADAKCTVSVIEPKN